MNFIKSFDKHINEALVLSEAKPYVLAWEESGGRERYKDWFNGKYRQYLEIVDKSVVQQEVEQVLSDNEYHIVNYKDNKVVKLSQPKNITSISRVLNRLEPDLRTKYDLDKDKQERSIDYLVVISRHPYDIAGMSTDRLQPDGKGWNSCMNIRTGSNSRYVMRDVKNGSIVAYLISRDDTNINKPHCRILMKPFDNNSGKTLLVADRVYPHDADVNGFSDTVEQWLIEKQGIVDGLYKLRSDLYDDGKDEVSNHHIMDMLYKKYDTVYRNKNSDLITVIKDDLYGIVNGVGREIVKPIYNDIRVMDSSWHGTGNRAIVKKYDDDNNKLLAMYNEHGKEIIPLDKYDYIEPPIRNFIFTEKDGKTAVFDIDGNMILDYDNRDIAPYNDTILKVENDNKYTFYNVKNPSKKYESFDEIFTESLTDDRQIFKNGEMYGVLNSEAEVIISAIIPEKPYNIELYKGTEDIFVVSCSGLKFGCGTRQSFISNNKFILEFGEYAFLGGTEENIVVCDDKGRLKTQSHIINLKSKTKIATYDRLSYLMVYNYDDSSPGFYLIEHNNKFGVYNVNIPEEIVEPIYDNIECSNGMIIIKNDGKRGILDIETNEISWINKNKGV